METRQSDPHYFQALAKHLSSLVNGNPIVAGSVTKDTAWAAYFCSVYVWNEWDHRALLKYYEFCTASRCARAWMHMLFFIPLTSTLFLSVSDAQWGVCACVFFFIWSSLVACLHLCILLSLCRNSCWGPAVSKPHFCLVIVVSGTAAVRLFLPININFHPNKCD